MIIMARIYHSDRNNLLYLKIVCARYLRLMLHVKLMESVRKLDRTKLYNALYGCISLALVLFVVYSVSSKAKVNI